MATFLRDIGIFGVALVLLLAGCNASRSALDNVAEDEELSVGYGTQGRSAVTGSVAHVKRENEMRIITRVEQLMERIPGVHIVPSVNGGFHVLVRGVTSVSGHNQPLYVIDGVTAYVDPTQGLYWLNPDDVKSISVLKDASATAIYGSRGASGVVVIKTRRR